MLFFDNWLEWPCEMRGWGTGNAICIVAMREKMPTSAPGFLFTLVVFVAAAYLILKAIEDKIPGR